MEEGDESTKDLSADDGESLEKDDVVVKIGLVGDAQVSKSVLSL